MTAPLSQACARPTACTRGHSRLQAREATVRLGLLARAAGGGLLRLSGAGWPHAVAADEVLTERCCAIACSPGISISPHCHAGCVEAQPAAVHACWSPAQRQHLLLQASSNTPNHTRCNGQHSAPSTQHPASSKAECPPVAHVSWLLGATAAART